MRKIKDNDLRTTAQRYRDERNQKIVDTFVSMRKKCFTLEVLYEKIGEQAGVSAATVRRVLQGAGLEGVQGLRKDLRRK